MTEQQQQAFNMVAQICSQVSLPLEGHKQLQAALEIIQAGLTPEGTGDTK